MSFHVPDHFFEDKFMEFVPDATRSGDGRLNGGCRFCDEGNSLGRKKRLFFYPDKGITVCYNCGLCLNKVGFIMKALNISYHEVGNMIRAEEGEVFSSSKTFINIREEYVKPAPRLPLDVINLTNKGQVAFYDEWSITSAIQIIRSRRLDTAKFRVDLFLSLGDFVHKDRIIIPFYDESGVLQFFQSRAQTFKHNEAGKYMSCLNGKKIFFGLNTINHSLPHIFVLEGPLDCFFVENAIGGGGIKYNAAQKAILDSYDVFFDMVYCLDNDFDNPEVFELYIEYAKSNKKVFLWGGKFEKCKDFNEYAMREEVDEIPTENILAHVYTGKDAIKIIMDKRNSSGQTSYFSPDSD